MVTCRHCGKPLILNGGNCIYCGTRQEKQSLPQNRQKNVNNKVVIQAVDLGLPSGTKWAPCNLGATNPWEYGGYYAWGEIEEKSIFNNKTYRWTWPNQKYCNDAFCANIDDKWVLEPEDDAAYMNWGGSWRIPTLKEYNELMYNCCNEWTVMNNVKGLRLISKINGKSLFFPAAGVRMDNGLTNKQCGYYKTSTLYEKNSQDAYVFLFITETNLQHGEMRIDPNLRELGQSVRPVSL